MLPASLAAEVTSAGGLTAQLSIADGEGLPDDVWKGRRRRRPQAFRLGQSPGQARNEESDHSGGRIQWPCTWPYARLIYDAIASFGVRVPGGGHAVFSRGALQYPAVQTSASPACLGRFSTNGRRDRDEIRYLRSVRQGC